MDGWFSSPPEDIKLFEEFLKLRIAANQQVERLCYFILFGSMADGGKYMWRCVDCNHSTSSQNDCSQRTSEFCQKEKAKTFFGSEYKESNYYVLWIRLRYELTSRSVEIIRVIGQDRYDAFMEFLTTNAHEGWERYSKTEKKEKNLSEPVITSSALTSLESIGNDPWEKFVREKIIKGDFGCLPYLDLGLLG